LGPKPGNISQNGPKATALMTSLTKNPHPQIKKLFWVQSRRLSDSFKPLNSSLAQSVEELGRWQGNWQLLVLGQNRSTNNRIPALKVLIIGKIKHLDKNQQQSSELHQSTLTHIWILV